MMIDLLIGFHIIMIKIKITKKIKLNKLPIIKEKVITLKKHPQY
jgi:hypothetical protein